MSVLPTVITMAGEMRKSVLSALENAVKELVSSMDPGLIPEVGSNIAYALPGARDKDEVAAVQGRIVNLSGQVHPVGPADFGASDHVARIVLTAMKFDPMIRCAANIRYSPEVIGIIEDLLLETCSFDRANEPPGTRTMDWGVAFCCRSGVPDVIFDRGAVGKEPMVRILAQDPAEVVGIIGRISNRYRNVPRNTGVNRDEGE
ncbi:MAG: phosphomethylpyrimidine kinase [Methanoregulaceae archaeon]|jgi:hydroxymethylpyrimidine/phosphomethylpyrimidine kinase|nr:phosphomethylpyrimidine kinase [Methanoregulaceae archaeon]